MSIPITIHSLKTDYLYYLYGKHNVDGLYKLNEILSDGSGIFQIGKIPINQSNPEVDYSASLYTNEKSSCITIHELNHECLGFLMSTYKVGNIYDLELKLSALQPNNNGIFVIGKIPIQGEINNNIDLNKTIKIVGDEDEQISLKEEEFCTQSDINITEVVPKDTITNVSKSSKDYLSLQEYGKGMLLKCLSKENPLYGKNWSSIFPDFDDSHGGWWKPLGSLKNKSLEGWFFKIDYLNDLLNSNLNIICDDLDNLKEENNSLKTEKEKKMVVSNVFDYEIIKNYLSQREEVENNIVFKVDSDYFNSNFNNFKMILIKHNDQIYSAVPHIKKQCLFFFGNIPF